jgi:ATP-dependent Clp protease ATP-binding subunit ClpA
MRLLPRRRPGPRAKTARPAEPYLAAGAEQARRLGHSYVGTEHVLLALIRNPDGGATALLRQLGVSTDTVEVRLARWLATSKPKIDPEASQPWESTSRRCGSGWRKPLGRVRSSEPPPASASVHG